MNKVVLITGGSRGIGATTAKYFAEHGYDVVITYCNSQKEAKESQKKLENKYHVSVEIMKCDLEQEEEIKEVVNQTINIFKRIDVLVNNAGIAIDTDLQDKTKENFQKIINVNLIGMFLISRLVGNYMKEQRFGSIINISSNNAIDSYYPESLDYDASKAGVISLTHNLAKYYAPIRVNCICPGWVETDMNKELDSEFKEKEINKILLKRFAKKEEIAEVIYMVAETSYINDTIIKVDGGRDV